MQRLKEAAEKAKIELSTLAQTNVNLPFLLVRARTARCTWMWTSRGRRWKNCAPICWTA